MSEPSQNPSINLTVQSANGKLTFKYKTDKKLKKLLDAYTDRALKFTPPLVGPLRFEFDGNVIGPDQTAGDFDMADGDQIDAFSESDEEVAVEEEVVEEEEIEEEGDPEVDAGADNGSATEEEDLEGAAGSHDKDTALAQEDGFTALLSNVLMAQSAEFEDTLTTWKRDWTSDDMLRDDVLAVYRLRSKHTSPACERCSKSDRCPRMPPLPASELPKLQSRHYSEYGLLSKYLLTNADEGRRLLEVLFGYDKHDDKQMYDARLRPYAQGLPKMHPGGRKRGRQ